MILIKGVDRLDIFLSTNEIAQLNEKMFDDVEHNRFEQAEKDLQLTNHYVEFWKSDKF